MVCGHDAPGGGVGCPSAGALHSLAAQHWCVKRCFSRDAPCTADALPSTGMQGASFAYPMPPTCRYRKERMALTLHVHGGITGALFYALAPMVSEADAVAEAEAKALVAFLTRTFLEHYQDSLDQFPTALLIAAKDGGKVSATAACHVCVCCHTASLRPPFPTLCAGGGGAGQVRWCGGGHQLPHCQVPGLSIHAAAAGSAGGRRSCQRKARQPRCCRSQWRAAKWRWCRWGPRSI